ncbi:MAG TPA: glycoside hydrolase domain-containing protein [Kofleriaceae bacterium]|nr:glycoside hydrolase domain-containing protein [Kofleriaceae bacterium]
MSSRGFLIVALCGAVSLHCGDPANRTGEPSGDGGGGGGGGGGDGGGGQGDDASPGPPAEGVAAAWAVTDGEKVERDDLSHPGKSGNAVWEDGVARLLAARNEIVSFQVVVEAGEAGIAGLDVRLPRLDHERGDAAIVHAPPAEDPTDYVGRPIQIFTENYMRVDQPSDAGWIYDPDGPEAPADATGWKPVQLVPESAMPGRGGLPVDVAARQNQAFWFDVYIPRGHPAGVYRGAVELRAGGGVTRVPVELEVLGFELPDRPTLTAMVYFEPGQVVRYQGRDLSDRYHRFAHRQRIELVDAYGPGAPAAARDRMDGSAYTAARGYQGPGEGTGDRVMPASFYGPGSAYDSRESAWQTSDAWMAELAEHAPGAITFLYMPDEPGPSEYDRIENIAENIKSNPGPGRALPIFVTRSYTGALDGSVDVWCSSAAGFRPDRAALERAKGNDYWFYNGTRPQTGALTIDAPATDARVNAWAAFKHGVDVYFYWHADHWRHNSQKQGERDQDVWADPVTFDNRGQPGKPVQHQGFINGDGVLIYPGEEVLHPEQDRGVAGPVSTVQLANLRRGVQDHAYLTMARQLGLAAEIEAALSTVVPGVFTGGPAVGFAERGDAFEEARRALARAIDAAR